MATNVKNKVLHTAAKLFLKQGYEKTSLRVLERESGVNYGSIMNAFENKESISKDNEKITSELVR